MNARIEAALKRFEEGKQTKDDFAFIEETLKDEKKLKRIKLAQKTLEKKTKEFLENKDALIEVHGEKWAAKQEEELSKKTETTQKLAKGIEQIAAITEKATIEVKHSPSSTTDLRIQGDVFAAFDDEAPKEEKKQERVDIVLKATNSMIKGFVSKEKEPQSSNTPASNVTKLNVKSNSRGL